MSEAVSQAAEDVRSVVKLARKLIQAPSRAGVDDYTAVLVVAEDWLASRGLEARRLFLDGRVVGLACTVTSGSGRHLVLDACVDTAPFGDLATWTSPPTSGAVTDGWLHGRGAADSKTGAAIFCHVASRLAGSCNTFGGSLTLLLDCDEHTGAFGGVRSFLADHAQPDGVMIGYPGLDHLVIGGRGFLRALITVHGESAHTGSSRTVGKNAVEKATLVVNQLAQPVAASATGSFPLPPKATTTAVVGGDPIAFSVVPDLCQVYVDVRLTPSFDAQQALRWLATITTSVDGRSPTTAATQVEQIGESWPAYQLSKSEPLVTALVEAGTEAGLELDLKVAGPSNIGNYLATFGVPATAGFGVTYRGLHATDERIEIASIPLVQQVYRQAALRFLQA